MVKKGLIFVCLLMAVTCFLLGWKQQTEWEVYWEPNREKVELEEILSKEQWGEDEYRTLFYQTGFSRRAIESMPEEERAEILLRAQETFFLEPTVGCTKNSIISWQEQNTNDFLPEIRGLEDGDILISFCTHAYGWRNGHAAIVVDAGEGRTLEAVLMGEDSCIQSVQKWRSYPSFLVLRLKNVSYDERKEIAQYALENMEGVPYGFVTDIIEHFKNRTKGTDTDCSHLIWKSFLAFGYDLDSDGGIIVTPRDIAESPLLEVIQVYGIDLETIREAE